MRRNGVGVVFVSLVVGLAIAAALMSPPSVYAAVPRGSTDRFTEFFDPLNVAHDNDLDHQSLLFTPDGSPAFYRACLTVVTGFPSSPLGGTPLTFLNGGDEDADDGAAQVTLTGGAQVSLYGTSYGSFYVGSNGYLTFTGPDVDRSESLAEHFAQRRVSGLFDDLDVGAAGTASWKQWGDRVVITFEEVPEWGTFNTNSFQIELFFDGRIRVTHLTIDATDGLVGLSAGLGVPNPFAESDLDGYPTCQPSDDCCSPRFDAGCGATTCQDCVCALDAFCCSDRWDAACVNQANNDCDFSCGCSSNPGNSCAAPIVIPAEGGVFPGMTAGFSTSGGSCGGTGSPEAVMQWTPTRSGAAMISTCGGTTDFDTILYVRAADCVSGTEVDCNDDDSGGSCPSGDSVLPLTVVAGQTYYIFVDGFGSGTFGEFTLRVRAPAPSGARLLASTGNEGGALIDIDRVTAAGTFFAPSGDFGPVTEIERRSDGVVFGATGQGTSGIITIDPKTGTESLVGAHQAGAVNGLEFVGNTLYGAYVSSPGGSSQLVVVNQATAQLTVIGATGFGALGGLAYNGSTATMYAVAGGSLITVNLATGAGTLVGATGFTEVGALEFARDGTLYGGTGGKDAAAGTLITVNPGTGAAMAVGATGFPAVSGLAFLDTAPLDVDGNGVVDVATDVTYVARRLLGLDPVPASFRVLDPTIPSNTVINAAIDALGLQLDVDNSGAVNVATDVTYIARHLLGLAPVPASFRVLDPTIPADAVIIAKIVLLT